MPICWTMNAQVLLLSHSVSPEPIYYSTSESVTDNSTSPREFGSQFASDRLCKFRVVRWLYPIGMESSDCDTKNQIPREDPRPILNPRLAVVPLNPPRTWTGTCSPSTVKEGKTMETINFKWNRAMLMFSYSSSQRYTTCARAMYLSKIFWKARYV